MKITQKSTRIARVTSEITNEAKFATEMIRKMEILIDREEFSNTNAVLMRSYGERLREVYDNFNKSWKDVISCYDTDEDLQRVADEIRITATRLEIQDMLSRAEVFEEKCRSIEDRNVDGDDVTVESTFRSEINMLRPEKIKLPNFSGNIRNFARFRKDFEKIVVPFYPDSVHQAYVMKENCLKGDVKNLVETLNENGHPEGKQPAIVNKPWGSYTVLDTGPSYVLKRIEVLPGEALSLQSHQHRSEHWTIVSGSAEVVRNKETFKLKTNDSITIPKSTKHRLGNPGSELLIIIEIQFGNLLDESDISRYEDRYGRC